jgi:hypothetical protein
MVSPITRGSQKKLDPIATKLNDGWKLCKVALVIITYTLVVATLKLQRIGTYDLGFSQTYCSISMKRIIVVTTINNSSLSM